MPVAEYKTTDRSFPEFTNDIPQVRLKYTLLEEEMIAAELEF